MATNGCFMQAKRVEPRIGWRAGLENRERQLRVGLFSSLVEEAAVSDVPAALEPATVRFGRLQRSLVASAVEGPVSEATDIWPAKASVSVQS